MLKLSNILLLSFTLLSSLAYSQPMEDVVDYLIFPIKPGTRNSLAGTMGELRSTHFHTGIDIRTEGREGLAVLAAADGFISRISVSPSGYGNALYLTHPNGHTTVYAHLKEFSEEIQDYVLNQQYLKERFALNLYPDANKFILSQGDTIALSGNSGSSGGPHLHFDLRDEQNALLNPLNYGFDEIIDTRSPYVKALALVTFSENARVNGEFGRKEFGVKPSGVNFIVPDTIQVSGTVGLEMYAWDRMNGTRFKTGINKIKVQVNGKVWFEQNINTWTFSEARYFYQHINYASLVNTRRRFNKLYVDDGNQLDFYGPVVDEGRIHISKGNIYNILVTMEDSYGNESSLKLLLKGIDPPSTISLDASPKPGFEIFEQYLKVTSTPDSLTNSGDLYIDGKKMVLQPNYLIDSTQGVYLWSLNNSLPDSLVLADTTLNFNLASRIPVNNEFKLYTEYADIVFKKRSLFDTLFMSLEHKIDTTKHLELLTIGDATTPLKNSIKVIMKPTQNLDDQTNYQVYQWYGGNNFGYVGGEWNDDRIIFNTRNLGTYTLVADSLKPNIKPLVLNKDRIVFQISDDLSGIAKIDAYLNDEWLLMVYDPKRKWLWAEKKNSEQDMQGPFVLKIRDNAGNTSEYNTNIN